MSDSTDDIISARTALTSPRSDRHWLIMSVLTSPKALFGLVILTVMIAFSLFSSQIAPFDPQHQQLAFRLKPPLTVDANGLRHILGTDALGRDVMSRIVFGARVSLVVGIAVALLASFIGVLLGLVSGLFGSWIDAAIMRLCDVQLALPAILLAIAVLAVAGSSLTNVVLILALTQWVTFARVVRAATLAEREKEYVLAARALGFGSLRIMLKYILPNVFAPIVVIATFSIAQAINAEAALSFLGLGIPPAIPSWGGMLSEGRTYLYTDWWLPTLPGAVISVCVIGVNLLGDWLRDYLDPRLRA